MLCACTTRHLKHNILQARCLSRRPMYPCSRRTSWNGGQIDDEISDLSPENIGRYASISMRAQISYEASFYLRSSELQQHFPAHIGLRQSHPDL